MRRAGPRSAGADAAASLVRAHPGPRRRRRPSLAALAGPAGLPGAAFVLALVLCPRSYSRSTPGSRCFPWQRSPSGRGRARAAPAVIALRRRTRQTGRSSVASRFAALSARGRRLRLRRPPRDRAAADDGWMSSALAAGTTCCSRSRTRPRSPAWPCSLRPPLSWVCSCARTPRSRSWADGLGRGARRRPRLRRRRGPERERRHRERGRRSCGRRARRRQPSARASMSGPRTRKRPSPPSTAAVQDPLSAG